MPTIDPRTPVLVGVGSCYQSVDDPVAAQDARELMAQAVLAAATDSGGRDMCSAVQQIAIPKGTWNHRDPAHAVARRIGAIGARTVLAELGVTQQSLINDALVAIASGWLDVAVVVGGEAKLRAALAAKAGLSRPETDEGEGTPDRQLSPRGEFVAGAEISAGLVAPVQQYAVIENALRHAEGQPLTKHRDDIAELWAGFNMVAQGNPQAAFASPRSAHLLRQPGPDNRPLAFPYNKWHNSQWTVDQAAALVLCSAGAARAHRVPRERWVFPRVALESSHALSLSRRRQLHRWPAMAVLRDAAARHLGRPLASIEHTEIYSCFPAAVRVQQRELGLPLEGVPTLTGGMTFAGGPLNNFTYQATEVVVSAVRAHPGSLGLITTVSGLLTKPGLMIWSAQADPAGPLIGDLATEAAAATESCQVLDWYRGPATVSGYTVLYRDLSPTRVVAICDTPQGSRCVAVAEDPDLAVRATRRELVGSPIEVDGRAFRPLADARPG